MYETRDNLIIGFHGCDAETGKLLLNNPNHLKIIEKPYDWLGHGMYFWENNYNRALLWAKEKAKRKEIKTPSVIGAVINLGYCFDLLDNRFIEMLKAYYDLMALNYRVLGNELPTNKDLKSDSNHDKILRELDCAVIEFMHQQIHIQIKEDVNLKGFSQYREFDSVRGVFTEGAAAYPGAGIFEKSHIQICIRNNNCIKGFFLPRNKDNL